MENSLRKGYVDIANQLESHFDLTNLYAWEEETYCDEVDEIERFAVDNFPAPILVETGASKMVIIREEKMPVIKIGFRGRYNYEYDEYDEEYKNTYRYIGANDGHNSDNYCLAEYHIYSMAPEVIKKCFAETERLSENIFAQEYAKSVYELREEGIYHDLDEETEKSTRSSSSGTDAANIFEIAWVADFIDTYGITSLFLLDNFIKENHINDLHNANYGYAADGRPVLIDYSSFND